MARQRGWRIVLRIEDLDTPRVKPGALDGVSRTLRALGLDWDEGPLVQSSDLAPYRSAMHQLVARGLAYPSEESRSSIEDVASAAASAPQEGTHEVAFPASMRPQRMPREFIEGQPPTNWRFKTPDTEVVFRDGFAGLQTHRPAGTVGDFVIWTKRGQPAYQLAVVVDDARQGVTHIVRGDDLLDSAARQLSLMEALGISAAPQYFHLPLVRGADGKRLAKRHGDTRVDTYLETGVPAERIVALVARWSGVEKPGEQMSAAEFSRVFDLDRLPRGDVLFTSADDRWLLEGRKKK